MEGLLRSLRAARDSDARRYLRIFLGDRGIGSVRRDQAGRLHAWPSLFEISDIRIQLRPADEPALSAAFAQVARALADDGAIRGWRGETYAIRASEGTPVLFHLERAAVRFFGLTSAAAHLNGFTIGNEFPAIWIARRSATKAIDPGMLDNLVAGGVTSGEDAWRTLLRECGEEAGIDAALAREARPAGTLHLRRDTPDGLNSEVIHVYDLALPAQFAPRNTDGEVGEFLAMDARALLERIARGELTVAAGLASADFALRHGMIQDEGGAIRAAIEACRAPTAT